MKKETLIRNLPLVLGIVLPFLFVITVSLMAYLPALGIRPAHDFLYTQETQPGYMYSYQYQNEYRIEDGRVLLVPSEAYVPSRDERPRVLAPQLYYYDSETGAAREISYEEARTFPVVAGPTSPDGYLIEYRVNSNGVFGLFGGSDNGSGYYVTKGGAGKELPALSAGARGYRDNVAIIGWVK